MDIFINSEKSPALIQAKATGSPQSGFKVKRGAVVPLTVTALGAQNATGLRMGIKAKGNYEGDLLILAEAAAGSQTELGTRFDLSLVASSLALNDATDDYHQRYYPPCHGCTGGSYRGISRSGPRGH